jgi:Cdc6-like AAA superfamily ATPase
MFQHLVEEFNCNH